MFISLFMCASDCNILCFFLPRVARNSAQHPACHLSNENCLSAYNLKFSFISPFSVVSSFSFPPLHLNILLQEKVHDSYCLFHFCQMSAASRLLYEKTVICNRIKDCSLPIHFDLSAFNKVKSKNTTSNQSFLSSKLFYWKLFCKLFQDQCFIICQGNWHKVRWYYKLS